MSSKTLSLKNIGYGGILKKINFDWSQGETIALMGRNGSGKSTLGKIINGLLEPEMGVINLSEKGVPLSWDEIPRWKTIGMVGQHPRRQTIGASVAEELAFGLLNLGMEVQEVQQRVKKLAAMVGLKGKENQSPSTLSGGERQRLVTTAVLALEPAFLIMDEALTMLDLHSQKKILNLLFEVKRKTGQLWITHDPELAKCADRLLLIKDGELVDVGNPAALENPELCKEYGIRALRSRQTFTNWDVQRVKKAESKNPALAWIGASYSNRLKLESTVWSNEFICVLGPSGAGKSTLLESVIGLINPDEGNFLAFGEPIKKNGIQSHRQKCRLVLQEPGEYFIGKTVYDEVYYHPGQKDSPEKRKENLLFLKEFGITEEQANRPPEQLSGGEKQRAALAAALHTVPQVLLLDEPMLGLDGQGQDTLSGVLRVLKGKTTILMVTHNLEESLELADRIWLVEQGEISLDCSAEQWNQYLDVWDKAGVRYPDSPSFCSKKNNGLH